MNCSDRVLSAACVIAGALLLAGCAASPRFAGRGDRSAAGTTAAPAPVRSIPPPNGRSLLTLEGVASYYAHDFNGRLTSNGETYDMNGMTAAHRTFPFGTKICVTNLENGRSAVVRVNDRGPFHEGRLIDLSLGAAKDLDVVKHGTARVRLEVIEWGTGK
jgi:rare lipoprotein A